MADPELPQRIFGEGQTLTGERVNIYQRMTVLRDLELALDDGEREFMYKSPFGKLFDATSKTPWSGAFGLFTLSRLLDVDKGNEIWILFAGRPIRFSMREFKIVTGLRCGKYPPSQKKKRRANTGDNFYDKLFGEEREITVEKVLHMLQNRSVTDKQMRLRYACLIIVDAILLPSVHYPRVKVDPDHAEMVEDLDSFIAYPWGRVSYDRIMESLSNRDFAQIATANVVVQGFFPAIQMVVLEAVPAIEEAVESSDEEERRSDRNLRRWGRQKNQIQMGKVRALDEEEELEVESIIRPEIDFDVEEEDISWSDDEEDPTVDHMVKLYNQGFHFKKELFGVGFSGEQLLGLGKRKIGYMKAKAALTRKGKGKFRKPSGNRKVGETSTAPGVELTTFRNLFDEKFESFASLVEGKIRDIVSEKLLEYEKKTREMWLAELSANNSVNNSIIIDGVTKWFNDNVNIEDAPARGQTAVSETHTQRTSLGKPPQQTNKESCAIPNNKPNLSVDDIVSHYGHPSFTVEPSVLPPRRKQTGCDDANRDGGGQEENLDKETLPEGGGNMREEIVDDAVMEEQDGHNYTVNVPVEPDIEKKEGGDNLSAEAEKSVTEEAQHDGGNSEVMDDDSAEYIPEGPRKSKRVKVASKIIDDRYVCQPPTKVRCGRDPPESEEVDGFNVRYQNALKSLKSSITVGVATVLTAKDVTDILGRQKFMSAKVMDALSKLSRHMLRIDTRKPRVEVLDCKFVSLLTRAFPKFSSSVNRGDYKFPKAVIERLHVSDEGDSVELLTEVDYVYLPFNLDTKHWVFLAVHLPSRKIEVLDCNAKLRTDMSMVREVGPIAIMMPYLLRQIAANETIEEIATNQFSIEHPFGIPQITSSYDAGLTAISLMLDHAVGGLDACREFNLSGLAMQAKKLTMVLIETYPD